MLEWKEVVKNSPIEWLLEKSNPSIRYFTLLDILDKREDDPKVVAAKWAIPESDVVRKILQTMRPEGYWENATSPYHPKYKSSYWQIMILGQLGMDKTDARVKTACENAYQLQLEEGGFSSYTPETALEEHALILKREKKLPSPNDFAASLVREHQYSCLTGNMATALTRIGYDTDSRLKKALEWLVKIQNEDGGWLCPYWQAHIRDKHGCFSGTICSLEAFSEVKTEHLTREMKETIDKGAEFLLMHHLFKADHHGYKIINKNWLTLGFPFFYSYNILRGSDVLTRLGYVKDKRLNDAIAVLLQKRQSDGSWILESAPIGRMQTNIEAKGKPSKWITLIALRVLKRLNSAI